MARKYSEAAQKEVEKAMRERKEKGWSREQAIAIGLDKARRKGAKAPRK